MGLQIIRVTFSSKKRAIYTYTIKCQESVVNETKQTRREGQEIGIGIRKWSIKVQTTFRISDKLMKCEFVKHKFAFNSITWLCP